MYRTLRQEDNNTYSGNCPECGKVIRLGSDLSVRSSCTHYVRRWRVKADKRVRVEYRPPQLALDA